MFRTYRLFDIAGIPIHVHGTVFPFLFFIGLAYGHNDFLVNVALGVAALLGPLMLHELGHALVAKRFGFSTDRIYLTPVGGLAAIKSFPETPKLEILVAIAGPLVNLALAPILWGLKLAWPCKFFEVLYAINLILALFNLLPGFPLDGGRILRAILATRKSYLDATRIACRVGQFFAGALCIVGVLEGYFSLVIISLLIFLGAKAELLVTTMRHDPAVKLGEAAQRWFRGQGGGFTHGFGFGDGFARDQQPFGNSSGESASRSARDDHGTGGGHGPDCVVDVDSDGKVGKIWRRDES